MTDSRVCVVTGARGLLGKALSRALSERGWLVAALDLHLDRYALDEPRIVYQSADVTNERELRQALARIEGQWGAPYALVNCAGIDSVPGRDDGTDPWRNWDSILAVNITGSANVCRVFGEPMVKFGRGSIVLIGSLYSLISPDQRMYDGFRKAAAYPVSKTAVIGLTRYLATMWGPFGVRVNCFAPGGIQSGQPEAFRQRYEQRVPLGRMGRGEDFCDTVEWLLSDRSGYVTGQVIAADGGYTAW